MAADMLEFMPYNERRATLTIRGNYREYCVLHHLYLTASLVISINIWILKYLDILIVHVWMFSA